MRKVVLFISASYLAFIAYANFGHIQTFSETEPLVTKSYRVTNLDSSAIAEFKKLNVDSPEITAIGTNLNEKSIGVTYKFQKITSAELAKTLEMNGKWQLIEIPRNESAKPFDKHAEAGIWSRLLSAHRFKN